VTGFCVLEARPAVAQSVYGFDDISLFGQSCFNGTGFTSGGGFTWGNFFAYTNQQGDCGPLTGLAAAVVSPHQAVEFGNVTRAGSPASFVFRATPFSFRGAYLTLSSSLFGSTIAMDLIGFLNGAQTDAATLLITQASPTFFAVSFDNVDALRISARLTGGIAGSDLYAMDNFTYGPAVSTVPEPQIVAMIAPILVPLLARSRLARRRRPA
jgi:hypothetical protein